MTLVELHLDVNRMADALEKIVFLLERLVYPQEPDRAPVRQATLDDLKIVTAENQAKVRQDQQEFAERFLVVPGSEAMMRAARDWEDQQRSLHGENWQPPEEDWKTIFAAAAREATGQDGVLRERSDQTPAAADSGR